MHASTTHAHHIASPQSGKQDGQGGAPSAHARQHVQPGSRTARAFARAHSGVGTPAEAHAMAAASWRCLARIWGKRLVWVRAGRAGARPMGCRQGSFLGSGPSCVFLRATSPSRLAADANDRSRRGQDTTAAGSCSPPSRGSRRGGTPRSAWATGLSAQQVRHTSSTKDFRRPRRALHASMARSSRPQAELHPAPLLHPLRVRVHGPTWVGIRHGAMRGCRARRRAFFCSALNPPHPWRA